MVNFIGRLPEREAILALPGVHWHDYGKEPRPGRKIGHCTVVAASAVERDRLVRKVLRRMAPG
jgi:5-(carboxyamino)imidazole ribonucleotide synthase